MKSPLSRTYILPTGYGFAFASVCILLLALAFASNNNAVYLLCFVMAALGVQSLMVTNKNIEKIDVTQFEVPDFFADEAGFALLGLHIALPFVAENIVCEIAKSPSAQLRQLLPGERRVIRLQMPKKPFGRHLAPNVKISSDFPFYFSRSWKIYKNPIEFYVYPARSGSAEFSSKAFQSEDDAAETQDDFRGHRDYRNNDSPRSIDWKVTSRLQKTTVKEYDSENMKKLWLRFEDAPGLNEEAKLNQLSLWIDLAEKKDYEYGLILKSLKIPLGRGPKHKAQCLRALV